MSNGRISIVAILAAILGFGVASKLNQSPLDDAPNVGCFENLVFTDALVHAGATDFVFQISEHADVALRMRNEISKGASFDILIVTNSDGPAEANQELVGDSFELCIEGDRPFLKAQ